MNISKFPPLKFFLLRYSLAELFSYQLLATRGPSLPRKPRVPVTNHNPATSFPSIILCEGSTIFVFDGAPRPAEGLEDPVPGRRSLRWVGWTGGRAGG